MKKYLKILLLFILAIAINYIAPNIINYFKSFDQTESIIIQTMWVLSLLFGFGWMAANTSEGTIFPSFTLQLILSFA